jgi:hypothetical protein
MGTKNWVVFSNMEVIFHLNKTSNWFKEKRRIEFIGIEMENIYKY